MDKQYEAGSAAGLISREGILRLRSPVKLYDGHANHEHIKPAGSGRLELLEARAGYASYLGRRELQKATHGTRPQQPARFEEPIPSQNTQSMQHPAVEGVLHPSNRAPADTISAERAHNMAVLAMEQRLKQLSQDLTESRNLNGRQHQQLQDLEAAYEQTLLDTEASAQTRLEALYQRLAQQHIRQLHFKVLAASTTAWLRCSREGRQLRSKMHRMQLQWLKQFWQRWLRQIEVTRRCSSKQRQLQALALAAWQEHTHTKARMQYKLQRFKQLQLQHAIGKWHKYVLHRQQLAQHVKRAERWHSSRTTCRSFQAWQRTWQKKLQLAESFAQKVLGRQTCAVLQEWHEAAAESRSQRLAALAAQQAAEQKPGLLMLQRIFARWQEYIGVQVQVRYLQHRYQQQLLQKCWRHWVQLPAARAQLEYVEAAFAAIGAQLLKHWGVQAFRQQTWECKAKLHLQQRRRRLCWAAWQRIAAAMARQRRLVTAKTAATQHQMLCRCFWHWCKASVLLASQRTASLMGKLQETIEQQQAGVASAEAQAHAALEQLRLLVIHNQQLQQQAVTACVGALAGLQFAPALRWRSLPFSTDQKHLQPRARHAVFRLEALQTSAQQAATNSWQATPATATTAAASIDVLLVYGGVAGDAWLTDLNLLVLQEDMNSNCKLRLLPAPCSNTSCCDTSSPADNSGATEAEAGHASSTEGTVEQQLPIAVRDFAACACGHNQFIVTGGFDGEQQTMDLQLCVLTRSQRQQAVHQADDVTSKAPDSNSSDHVGTWCGGWSATWQMLQPRNRSPTGRCHHTVCHYAEGRSLVVFGGWTNRQGCLNDVWLLHQDHLEWWEPECTGADVPCHRRSHAAVVLGHQLFVYGGLSSQGQHLDDLWCLDMTTWEWQQAATKECLRPAARRAASLELVGDRYLLLHGGYAGIHQLLNDTWVFDTHSNRWLVVDVSAPASELPVPRALHTLTRVGHRFLVIGGQGACGPVPDVHLLECPAVIRGLQLEQQHLRSQFDLVHSKRRCAQLDGDLACRVAEMQEYRRQLQGSKDASTLLTNRCTAVQHECSSLQQQLEVAQQAAAAASLQAEESQQHVSALERRLLRARGGGSKAVEVAKEQEEQLQAADTYIMMLQQNLQECQTQQQQQQVQLSRRNAEVANLQAELQACRARMLMLLQTAH